MGQKIILKNKSIKQTSVLTWLIAVVWIVNGLFCKVLNLVPRHRQIVSEILGNEHSAFLTTLIGIAEIIMAIWIISGYRSRFNAITQVIVILVMNIIEFILVSDLLLWGKFNTIFALLFILIILYNEFVLNKPQEY